MKRKKIYGLSVSLTQRTKCLLNFSLTRRKFNKTLQRTTIILEGNCNLHNWFQSSACSVSSLMVVPVRLIKDLPTWFLQFLVCNSHYPFQPNKPQIWNEALWAWQQHKEEFVKFPRNHFGYRVFKLIQISTWKYLWLAHMPQHVECLSNFIWHHFSFGDNQ